MQSNARHRRAQARPSRFAVRPTQTYPLKQPLAKVDQVARNVSQGRVANAGRRGSGLRGGQPGRLFQRGLAVRL